MIAPHDKVRTTVVFADQSVPNRLARTSHAHGKVQKAHRRGGRRVLIQHRLVTTYTGKVVNIARLGHADHRVDQQVRLRFFCGTERKFLVGAVQGVAGLERNDFAPAHFAEIGA